VAGGVGVDSILWFSLEGGGDGTERCRKMKQKHQAHFDSIERKCDTTRWCDNVDQRRGGTGKGKGMICHELGPRK
jgi:hypothetical protein